MNSASTATTAAAALAALPPRPLDERQALANAERDAAPLAGAVQQGLRRDAGGVPGRLARQTPGVAGDVVDGDAGRGRPRGHFVAWRGERKAEHVEATGDVRHGRRRESGHCIHGSTILSDGLRVAGDELRTPGCGVPTTGYRPGSGLNVADFSISASPATRSP